MKRSAKTRTTPRGLRAVLSCRAAVVPPDPVLCRLHRRWPSPSWHRTGGRGKLPSQKAANSAHARLRTPGCARQAARSGRARQRSAQDLVHPAQAPLLPLARWADRQGHPHRPNQRDPRMNPARCFRRVGLEPLKAKLRGSSSKKLSGLRKVYARCGPPKFLPVDQG
jgi:hypothetical protein